MKNKIFQSRDLCLRTLDTNSACAKSVRRNEDKNDMTMRERIAAGKLFTDCCEGLPEDRINCKKRMQALSELLGKETAAWVEPLFYCYYGTN